MALIEIVEVQGVAGIYDLRLVVLSVVVAAFASYTALDLAGRVNPSRGRSSWIWLFGGAFSMGTGIWSMHFIGMLAFRLPIQMAYDLPITILSMIIAILVSGFALFVMRRPILTHSNLSAGAALMGIGISAMHYTGMAAMQMSPPIQYHPLLFIASVIVAIIASMAALWIAFQLRQKRSTLAVLAKLGSAAVMGLAITGMHYTGMAAAQFAPGSVCLAVDSTGGMDSSMLAMIIGVLTLCVLVGTLVISAFDAQFAVRTAKLAESLHTANEQLRNIALYDKLTELPNRVLLDDRLSQAMSRADRERNSFALMFVDLDNFKPVNDEFGHHIGDELLKAVAQRLTGCVRKADTVARLGGDEFVVLLHQILNAKDAALTSKKVIDELSRPFHIAQKALNISCSIGISVYPQDGTSTATLMINADAAMYQAKKAGRNGYEFFVAGSTSPIPSTGS